MKTINLDGDVKQQFRDNGLSYPKLKSSGKYGLGGSTLLDRHNEEEALEAVIDYLVKRNIIELTYDYVESSVNGYGGLTV